MIGSCLCGGVVFEIDGEPGSPIELCHCPRCRKASGSAFAATFLVGAGHLSWRRGAELVATYEAPVRERPPGYRRVFCRTCGSPLPIVHADHGIAEIPAGVVDGDPGARPARHIFVAAKAPWFEITGELPRHAHRPDRGSAPGSGGSSGSGGSGGGA
jgi:hypothetical protein